MSLSYYFIPIISSLFRLFSYAFLRIIPSPIGKIIIPTLYSIYVTILLFVPHQPANKTPNCKSNAYGGSARNTVFSHTRTVVLSLPATSKRLTALSFVINTILLIFSVDLATYSIRHPAHDVTFTRLGAIDHQSAKIVIRYPRDGSNDTSLRVLYRQAEHPQEASWMIGPLVQLSAEDDWTDTTVIAGLWPSTSYEYAFAESQPSVQFPIYPPSPVKFRTFPDPRLASGSHFRFIATSCILPNFPYIPTQGDKIKGFDLLFDYLYKDKDNGRSMFNTTATTLSANQRGDTDSAGASGNLLQNYSIPGPVHTLLPEFLLFLGDFIYADVPTFFGDSIESYRRLYRRNYASLSFRRVYERLPILHIYDDHEVFNNFAGTSKIIGHQYPNASNAFELYSGKANHNSLSRDEYYFHFRYGDNAFFVMDTRRHRSDIQHSDPQERTMLGGVQLEAIQSWLSEVNHTACYKFIVSSVPFTSLWQYDALKDSWAAYPAEKRLLLNLFHSVPNVILISGDRHEFAAIEFAAPSPWSHSVLEISTSPLSMFYVPLVRTLRMESEKRVERVVQRSVEDPERGQRREIETQWIPEERVLWYKPVGNYKWTSFEVDSRDNNRPIVKFEVMIDGHASLRFSREGDPITLRRSTALGALVPQPIQGLLDRIGLIPSKWF